MCDYVERSHYAHQAREVYKSIRKITNDYVPRIRAVKDERGLIIREQEQIQSRWCDYFNKLYNDPNPVDNKWIEKPQIATDTTPTPGILTEEVESALHKLKYNKAPGVDNVTAKELQVACMEEGMIMMHQLLQRVWDTETIPNDWKRAIIIPIHKKEGQDGM